MVMSEDYARNIMLEELKKHKLFRWRVGFNHRKSSVGLTKFGSRTIELSVYLIRYSSNEQIIDTIRHEIAHAIQFETFGYSNHDKEWKKIASMIGANPSRTIEDADFSKKILKKYSYSCQCCGITFGASRKLIRLDRRFCKHCYDLYNKKCRFIEVQNW